MPKLTADIVHRRLKRAKAHHAGSGPEDGREAAVVLRPSRDIMSREKRSALMARIRGKNTKCELVIGEAMSALGLSYESHCMDLPGRPDFVLRGERVAVFVDGDFWHGWRFSRWRHKLTGRWEDKISENRRRDRRNHARLRRMGWTVVRLWEHQVHADLDACLVRITRAL